MTSKQKRKTTEMQLTKKSQSTLIESMPLIDIYDKINRFMSKVDAYNSVGELSFGQYILLDLVDSRVDNPSEIADALSVRRAAISRRTSRLIQFECIEVTQQTTDRRKINLELTKKGHEVLDKYNAYFNNVYTKEELQQISKAVSLLDKID